MTGTYSLELTEIELIQLRDALNASRHGASYNLERKVHARITDIYEEARLAPMSADDIDMEAMTEVERYFDPTGPFTDEVIAEHAEQIVGGRVPDGAAPDSHPQFDEVVAAVRMYAESAVEETVPVA